MNGWIKPTSMTVALAATVLTLAGCGVGQVSQVATQEPAINGVAGSTGSIQLRNVHLRGEQELDYIEPPSEVELILAIANMSPEAGDRLVEITSDVGTVEITGDTDVKASSSLIVGRADGVPENVDVIEGATHADAIVTLTEPITNGLTYEFVFSFEKAGDATVSVPLDAGMEPRREEGGEDSHSSDEGH